MSVKFALTTLLLSTTWLLFENFNILESVPRSTSLHPVSAGSETFRGLSGKGSDIFPMDSWLNPAHNAIRIKKIVLDAGHGGKDPGCIGVNNSHEKHNALAIILKLGGLIEANYPDIEVIYTRDSDVFVELKERAEIANRNHADLFISVHCNAMSVASSKGTETYVLGLHKAAHNLEVAKRENASIYMEENYKRDYKGYDPNSTEAHILGSMWQSAYLEQSILLASFVQENVKKYAKREDRGVKQAGFLVLKETAMPSILVESGYMTNEGEEGFLLSDEGRDKMALSIFHAFEQYKNQMEGNVAVRTTAVKPAVQKTVSNPTVARENVAPPQKTSKASTASPAKNNSTSNACRVWLMSWPKKMDVHAGQLSLLSNVKEEYANGEYQYYAENYAKCEDAERMLPEIRNLGFKNAKLVK